MECATKCPGCKDNMIVVQNGDVPAYSQGFNDNGSTGGSGAVAVAGVAGQVVPFAIPVLPNSASSGDSASTGGVPFPGGTGESVVPLPQIRETTGGSQSDGRTAGDWAQDQHQFSHLPPLPEGWIRVSSKSTGEIYFCHVPTGETTFKEPTGPPSRALAAGSSGDLPPGWVEMRSRSSGQVYYWNEELEKSQFERPTAALYAEFTGGLAAGWEEVVSKTTGQTYYWNAALQQSTFVRPVGNDSTISAESTAKDNGLPPGWVAMVSRSTGKTYYYNTDTQQSQFEMPI